MLSKKCLAFNISPLLAKLRRKKTMRNVISSQLEIGQVDIANIVIDVTSRDDIPLILLGLQHIYTTGPLKEAVFKILQEVPAQEQKRQ